MRTIAALTFILLLFGALPPTAEADCAPPCGPIPVIIDIETGDKKKFAFGAEESLVLEGVVSYYVNVDGDGFWFDPQNEPKITFRVNKQPPWVKTTIEPSEFTVPLSDPRYLSPEGSPEELQLQYYWEAPIKITYKKLRDPTAEEIAPDSPFIRSDGTYRVTLSASSTASVLAPEVFGPNMGVQEGYAVKEIRIVPEIGGVALVDGLLPNEPKGTAPAPVAAWLAVLLLGVAVFVRRRR